VTNYDFREAGRHRRGREHRRQGIEASRNAEMVYVDLPDIVVAVLASARLSGAEIPAETIAVLEAWALGDGSTHILRAHAEDIKRRHSIS
jgi:hypothetical protein